MGKAKVLKPFLTAPQKAMHSRVSYLYQAATHLATQQMQLPQDGREVNEDEDNNSRSPRTDYANQTLLPRQIVTEIRAIVLKAQLRPSQAVKQSICKNCDTLLLEGSTCVTRVENKSKGGKKPWADVQLRRCTVCEKETRTPLAAQRQKRKTLRLPGGAAMDIP